MTNKQSWEIDFDEKFTRQDKGLENQGKYRDDWFVKDAIQSKEIKDFISNLLTSKSEQMESINYKNYTDPYKSGFNAGISACIEILKK